ncbi:MAG TPA: metallopeptidase TldD-related protein [Candidatus Udaeobacter sp.]|nr:metallopeptidase TldD-related protein [Candidatus Udaeobacter sp.]
MKIFEPSSTWEKLRFRRLQFLRVVACWVLAAQLVFVPLAYGTAEKSNSLVPEASASDPVLNAIQGELARATSELGKAEQPPYYLSYTVYDQEFTVLVGAYGSLLNATAVQRRQADVTMRVGTPELDNTHGQSRASGVTSGSLPFGNDQDAIARALWELTDREFKRAVPTLLNVRTNTAVRAEEEDKSPDFSKEKPQTHLGEVSPPAPFDRSAWEGEIKRLSAAFRKYREVYFATVVLQVQRSNSRMVSSEGSSIVSPSASTRLVMEAQTRAEDGMDLLRVETFQAPSASALPSEADLSAKVEKMAADLNALRKAPVAEPYDGPALLSGRAAAVFFHEVLGHRLEGHRQRDEEEGQTFTKKVGQEVLPKFLSVIDDPTMHEIAGVKLAGAYDFDNEGEPAQRVNIIENGVLKNFLLSRMPIKDFANSNGHGRNQPGLMPTGRQGNLIVTSSQTVPDSQLRQELIDEAKKQNKPYGLYFDDIQGGFTLTSRSLPQAFQVLPVIVYKVYADGRPDELVRGVDIVGTPLAALTRILLTGDQPHVFNGVCGAESGQVPVAAVAPAMLFSEMEVQKRGHEHERPPLLPPPGFEDTSAAKDAQAKAEVRQ